MGLNIQGCFGQNLVYFPNAIGKPLAVPLHAETPHQPVLASVRS